MSASSGIPEGSTAQISVSATPPPGQSGAANFLIDFGDGGTGAVGPASGVSGPVRHVYRQNGTYVVSVAASLTDRLTGFSSTVVVARMVSPWNTGFGKLVSVMPRLANIVTWPPAVAPPWLPMAGTMNGEAP